MATATAVILGVVVGVVLMAIAKFIVGLVWSAAIGIANTLLTQKFVEFTNLQNAFPTLSGISLSTVLTTIAWTLLVLIIIVSCLKAILGPVLGKETYSPTQIVIRAVAIGIFLIIFPKLTEWFYGTLDTVISALNVHWDKGVFSDVSAVSTMLGGDGLWGFGEDSYYVVPIFCGVMLASSVIPAAITYIERALTLVLFVSFGPICIALGADKDNSHIVKEWLQGVIASTITIILNVYLFQIFNLQMKNMASQDGSGKSIFYFAVAIVLMTFIKSSERFINQLGFRTIASGDTAREFSGAIGKTLVGGYAIGKAATSAIRTGKKIYDEHTKLPKTSMGGSPNNDLFKNKDTSKLALEGAGKNVLPTNTDSKITNWRNGKKNAQMAHQNKLENIGRAVAQNQAKQSNGQMGRKLTQGEFDNLMTQNGIGTLNGNKLNGNASEHRKAKQLSDSAYTAYSEAYNKAAIAQDKMNTVKNEFSKGPGGVGQLLNDKNLCEDLKINVPEHGNGPITFDSKMLSDCYGFEASNFTPTSSAQLVSVNSFKDGRLSVLKDEQGNSILEKYDTEAKGYGIMITGDVVNGDKVESETRFFPLSTNDDMSWGEITSAPDLGVSVMTEDGGARNVGDAPYLKDGNYANTYTFSNSGGALGEETSYYNLKMSDTSKDINRKYNNEIIKDDVKAHEVYYDNMYGDKNITQDDKDYAGQLQRGSVVDGELDPPKGMEMGVEKSRYLYFRNKEDIPTESFVQQKIKKYKGE